MQVVEPRRDEDGLGAQVARALVPRNTGARMMSLGYTTRGAHVDRTRTAALRATAPRTDRTRGVRANDLRLLTETARSRFAPYMVCFFFFFFFFISVFGFRSVMYYDVRYSLRLLRARKCKKQIIRERERKL